MECCLPCGACLAISRRTFILSIHRDLFYSIINISENQSSKQSLKETEPRLCWECMRLLQNISKFRNNVIQCQKMLYLARQNKRSNKYLPCLSTLATSTKTDYDEIIHYNEDSDKSINDNKHEIDEISFNSLRSDNLSEDIINNRDNENENSSDELYESCSIKSENNVNDLNETFNQSLENESTKQESDTEVSENSDSDSDYIDDTHTIVKKPFNGSCKSKRKQHYKSIDKNTLKQLKSELMVKLRNTEEGILQDSDSVCTKTSDNKDTSINHKDHNSSYKCLLCSKESCNEKHFNAHFIAYQCTGCYAYFRYRRDFYDHYNEWHTKHICDYCNKTFGKRNSLENHIRQIHLAVRCKICNSTLKNGNSYKSHMQFMHTEQKSEATYCVECNRHFPNVWKYRSHISCSVRHKRLKVTSRVPCPKCSKTYHNKVSMLNHYQFVHENRSRHRCGPCDQHFLSASSLKLHKDKYHLKVERARNKMCNVCDRGFQVGLDLELNNVNRGVLR